MASFTAAALSSHACGDDSSGSRFPASSAFVFAGAATFCIGFGIWIGRKMTVEDCLASRMDRLEAAVRALTNAASSAAQSPSNSLTYHESVSFSRERALSAEEDVESLSVGTWTSVQVREWLETVVRRFKGDTEASWLASSFANVDGSALLDLVLDDAHGISLSQKLSFMGVPEAECVLLASEMAAAVAHGYVSGSASAVSSSAESRSIIY